ncbi:MAG: tetratricopeptide repeat protein, partial [Candidatus Neomarinimicrobiota bacterium]
MNNYEKMRGQIIWILFICVGLMSGCSQVSNVQTDNSTKLINDADEETNGLDLINTEVLGHIMDGQLYLDQGDFAMAIVELQEALRLDPNISAVYLSLAECYWKLNKHDRSLEYLETAVEIDPTNLTAQEVLAEQFLRLQRFSEAQEHYEILLDLNPENEDYLFALADIAKIQKNYDQAISYYVDIYEINNNTIQALELAADLVHRLGKLDKAEELYQKLIEADSLNINYLGAYININVQLNKSKEAIELAKKIIEIEGSSIDNLMQLGILYNELEKFNEAIEIFQGILQKDSTNTTGLHLLSTIHSDSGEYKKAQFYADKMIAAWPENPQGYINSALIALNQDDNDEAIKILISVAPNFPEEYGIHYMLGMSFNLAENYKMAAVYLENARQIIPNSRNTLHVLAIVNENLDNWKISDEIYQQLIQTDSTDAQALNNYAYSLVERGEKIE